MLHHPARNANPHPVGMDSVTAMVSSLPKQSNATNPITSAQTHNIQTKEVCLEAHASPTALTAGALIPRHLTTSNPPPPT